MAEQAQELDVAAQQLVDKTQAIDEQHRFVVAERSEMDRHLLDLRGWYRQKLRELAGVPVLDGTAAEVSEAEASPAHEQASDAPRARGRLRLPAKRDSGRCPGSDPSRHPVHDGAARGGGPAPGRNAACSANDRRRYADRPAHRGAAAAAPLRQVLLASGVVTLYQLALIESGKVEGLMLGPVRVIDRLKTTGHETVYRVFDLRRGQEAVLRHLAAEEMHDAVRPDEFRQRFSQALINDPHLAATYEVLDLDGRPAALQEWITGLPATDWPPLAAAPGVCYRLLTQAALGLSAGHQAGLIHGHLDDSLVLLTGAGIVKICGFGEPPWLAPKHVAEASVAGDVVRPRPHRGELVPADGDSQGAKTKPLPEDLLNILQRLTTETGAVYSAASELLEDLDRAGSDIPPNAEAWDRLLKYVRENESPEALLRQTA